LTNPLFQAAIQMGLLTSVMAEKGAVLTEVNLLRIGPCWLATVPGELLPKLGLAIKGNLLRAGARVAGIIGLANDELGYLLPEEDFAFPEDPFNPGSHYEETMSVGPQAGKLVVEAVQALIASIL